MRKFNGVPTAHFGLFLKGCEWRFNNPSPQAQLLQLNNELNNIWASYLGQPQEILMCDIFFDELETILIA